MYRLLRPAVVGTALALSLCLGACSSGAQPSQASPEAETDSDVSATETYDSDSTTAESSSAEDAEKWSGPSEDEAEALPALFPDADDKSALKKAYTCSIAGSSYSLPMPMSDFIAAGWTTERPEGWSHGYYEAPSEPLEAMTYAPVTLFKDGEGIEARVVNSSENAVEWQDAVLGGFDIGDSNSPKTFMLSSGIGLGSSVEDVLAAYGSPYNTSSTLTADGAKYLSDIGYSAVGKKEKEEATGSYIDVNPVNTLRNGYDGMRFSIDSNGKVYSMYIYITI